MIKFFIAFIAFGTLLFAVEETSSSLTKQRIEVMELKKQLNNIIYKLLPIRGLLIMKSNLKTVVLLKHY